MFKILFIILLFSIIILAKSNQNTLDTSCNLSKEMNEIIKILEEDNYNVKNIYEKDSLEFCYEEILENSSQKIDFNSKRDSIESNSIENMFKRETYKIGSSNFNCFEVKSNKSIENLNVMFPRFKVYQLCFENEKQATDYENLLNRIIYEFDLCNDKRYDYLVRNKSEIIYVLCEVNMFQSYAFKYKDILNIIINN